MWRNSLTLFVSVLLTLAALPAMAVERQKIYTLRNAQGADAAYVYARGEHGFVITAADEAQTVLGYSDEGRFDSSTMPESLREMLQRYAASAEMREAVKREGRRVRHREAEGAIDPLLGEIRWGQQLPYNQQCPWALTNAASGGRAATGCMTTALAQIMRYHRYPQHGYGSAFQMVTRGVAKDPTTINYYDHKYNWDAMLYHKDDYPYSMTAGGNRYYNEDEVSNAEVAQFMFDLAVALRTSFAGVSGAANIRIIPALLSYFNYDPSIELVTRRQVESDEAWDAMLLEELQAGRPVYLEGLTEDKSSGHAFVCDGYDGQGYFHINWGWDGTSNGYFLMTALNPTTQGIGGGNSGYSTGLTMVRHIMPCQTEDVPHPYMYCLDYKSGEVGLSVETDGEGKTFYGGRFTVNDRYNIRARMGLLVLLPDGRKVMAYHGDGEIVQILDKQTFYDFRVDERTEWRQPGTRLYYIYKEEGPGTEWQYMQNRDGLYCGILLRDAGNGEIGYSVLRTEPDEAIESRDVPVAVAEHHIQKRAEQSPVYDLTGRRQRNTERGIFVDDGQKRLGR